MQETVLAFMLPDKSIRNDLRNIFGGMKVQMKYIERPLYNRTLAVLAGMEPMKDKPVPYDGPEFEMPMLIFANMEDRRVGEALQKLRAYEGCTIPLKAVMTDTSRNWAAAYAYIHIRAEHESMIKQRTEGEND